MAKKNKFIGVCGTNLFEQNSTNFLLALKESELLSDYTTIAFSNCASELENLDDLFSEAPLIDLSKYIDLECIIMLSETIKNTDLINYIVKVGTEKNIPVFSIDRVVDGCYNMPLNYSTGFREMVSHVITEHKVTKVNMLAGMRNNSFSEERVDMYKEVLKENDIPFEPGRLEYGDFWERPALIAMKKFFTSGLEMPEAIVCANDSMAITACSFLSEMGLKVPEDIIVTGFDGTESAAYHYPSLTTCAPDYKEAIEFIMAQTKLVQETGKLSPCERMINFKLVKGQSCGCEPDVIHDNSRIISSLYDDVGDAAWHTIAMNPLVTSLLDKSSIEDIVHLLPRTVHLWSNHFRFACIKSELLSDNINMTEFRDSSGNFGKMSTIFYVNNYEFDESLKEFDVKEFIPDFENLITKKGTLFVARILKNGKNAYGYTVDEFITLDHRHLQQCNEFAMFLTHSINTVLHNYELNQLNRNLEKAYQEIATLSVHDPMTGLLNRRGFFNILDNLITMDEHMGKYLYVVNVDLDRLKYINDNFGHSEGDFAITSIAHSLQKLDVNNLVCARFGGDEFTCTFFDKSPEAYDRKTLTEMIKDILAKTPGIFAKEYPVDFSVGLCCKQIGDDMNLESMISAADAEMYADKATKKRRKTDREA